MERDGERWREILERERESERQKGKARNVERREISMLVHRVVSQGSA